MASTWFAGFEEHDHVVNGTLIHARIGGRADAPALLLMHGFPQTHVMWHRVAQVLAPHYRLVLPDLRGYGDSARPPDGVDHLGHAKRTMAADMAALMQLLGHASYGVVGHDRGGRVAHRLALDHPHAVSRLAVLDIVPTLDMYESTDMRFASAYYHWFYLIQPAPHPERMIGADPAHYLYWKLGGWGARGVGSYEAQALAEYERCIARPDTIHAMCEDYRASAGIDLEHDRESRERGDKIACDLLALWGERGVIQSLFDPMTLWRRQCRGRVTGQCMPCGHFLAEEQPEETARLLHGFFSGS